MSSDLQQNGRFGIPQLPPQLPARNNPLLQKTAAFLFWLWGWQFDGNLPDNTTQAIALGAPHTSNWDFVIAMIAIFGINVRLSLMGKHTIFIWPFRSLLRWMDVIPADRRAPNGLVGEAIRQFEQNPRFVLGIAPEGTRSKVKRWRTGFYHIAKGAGVPVVPIGLDFANKRIKVGKAMHVTDDMEADMAKFQAFYDDVTGKIPHSGWEK